MHPVQKANAAWEANAIEECMADPEYAAKVHRGEWCANCEMRHPCLCDKDRTVREMREYYEANRRIERTNFFGRVVVEREEPKDIGSWGRDMDGLMTGLYKIARKRYEEELRKARGQS